MIQKRAILFFNVLISSVYNLFLNYQMELAIIVILLCVVISHGSFHIVSNNAFIEIAT